ncbi:MAG: VOC family protein [Eubacteriales bacterium]|nr:VOC family protein [Eubacteriales bacterium]
MDIDFHSTVLITDKFEKMKAFYTDVLCQSIRYDFGNCVSFDCALAIWELKDAYPITRALGERYHHAPNKNIEICFETGDFDGDVKRLKEHGIALLHDVAEETWGQKTIRFYDPDGNIVELGESMRCFCRRLYDSGLSVPGIAEKAGVPLRAVMRFLWV